MLLEAQNNNIKEINLISRNAFLIVILKIINSRGRINCIRVEVSIIHRLDIEEDPEAFMIIVLLLVLIHH